MADELGAILVAAGLSSARDHALVSLLALNGLRVSEALGADIDALGLERWHRTLTVVRKGGKTATVPLAPRVARAVDLAIADLDGLALVELFEEKSHRSNASSGLRFSSTPRIMSHGRGRIGPAKTCCRSAATFTNVGTATRAVALLSPTQASPSTRSTD